METLITSVQYQQQISKLALDISKVHAEDSGMIVIGIQQGGVVIAESIVDELRKLLPGVEIQDGQLDITFYRDDFRNAILAPDKMNLPFSIENKVIVLVDDVLFTGRTIKAALDALLDYGRPAKVELCVLVDRKEHRQFPIQADFVGQIVNTKKTDKVKMIRNNNGNLEVALISEN